MNNVNFIALVWHQIIKLHNFHEFASYHTMYIYNTEMKHMNTCTLVFYRESSIHNIFLHSAKILRHDNLALKILRRDNCDYCTSRTLSGNHRKRDGHFPAPPM